MAEMVLDDHQQKQFQKWMDAITLRLIDLNPIRHYRRLSEKRPFMVWFGVSIACAWAIFGVMVAMAWEDVEPQLRDPGIRRDNAIVFGYGLPS